MSSPKPVSSTELRVRFASRLSSLYGTEVPAYTTLVEVSHEVNQRVMARDGSDAERLGSIDRVTAERHGAIRVGSPRELAQVARVFGALGMFPCGFYDLRDAAPAPIPVVSTAFRPVDRDELAANPFRVFTSMLVPEDRRFFDRDLESRLRSFIDARELFPDELLSLADAAIEHGELSAADADRYLELAAASFALSPEPVDQNWYAELERVSAVAADIGGVTTTHINHLTPRVLDIDDLYVSMQERGIEMIDEIQGPPRWDGPDVLLRQTSFRALAEPRTFRTADGAVCEGTLRVRFGEVEARGIALTPAGRERFDELVAAVDRRLVDHPDRVRAEVAAQVWSEGLPSTERELFLLGLGSFTFRVDDRVVAGQVSPEQSAALDRGEVSALVRAGVLHLEPIVYEDFLPRSAAGIFASNLADGGTVDSNQGGAERDAGWMADVMGRPVNVPEEIYADEASASLSAAERDNLVMGGDTVSTFCPLCVSRCGARATVEDGRFVALHPDPSHPTGKALCVKGKAAPQILYHESRLLHPLRRTNPKDSVDPGWERITWDEALDTVAERLLARAASDGPESVGFSSSSPSTSAISDSIDWVQRLIRAFGSPNFCTYMELCGWGRFLAPLYTFGASVPGFYLPDLENAGCILFWGYNPSVARLAHATSTAAAVARGAKLIVVDPRKVGLAAKADHWLRVRPGTDAALSLSLTHVMIENGWYDADFVRDWTNAADEVDGHTVWDLLGSRCAEFPPDVAAEITGVPAADIVAAARTLWESRPVAFYTWSGLEQHSGTTQTMRAINVLYALTGSLDVKGGNVLFEAVPSNRIDGMEFLSGTRPPAIGVDKRPLGPARFEFVTGEDFYTAALDHRIKAVVGFGGNPVMAHGDSGRGRDALRSLDFFVQADLFMTPTAELADIVLPVTTPFESEALKIGFEYSQEAQSLVQLRQPLVPPRGEARSDLQIVFDLATRLSLGEHFWDGDIEAAFRHQLAPSGITLEELRANPAGVRVPLTTRYRKYADNGFATPSRKVELYSTTLAAHGYSPLPAFEEPLTSPRSRPDLADRYPLVLSCAKSVFFCETQHRQVAALRKSAPDPQVEIHPSTAAARGISAGDWVSLDTPHGSVRARAKLNASLDPDVVFGQHGWWEACEELELPGYPPYGPGSANLNLVLRQTPSDPISGSSPLRASVCDVAPLSAVSATTADAALP